MLSRAPVARSSTGPDLIFVYLWYESRLVADAFAEVPLEEPQLLLKNGFTVGADFLESAAHQEFVFEFQLGNLLAAAAHAQHRLLKLPNDDVLQLQIEQHLHLVLLARLSDQHETQMVPHKHHWLPQCTTEATRHRPACKLHCRAHLPLLAVGLELLDVAQLEVSYLWSNPGVLDVFVAQLAQAVERDEQLAQVLLLAELIFAGEQPRRELLELFRWVIERLFDLSGQSRTHFALNDAQQFVAATAKGLYQQGCFGRVGLDGVLFQNIIQQPIYGVDCFLAEGQLGQGQR